MQPRPYIKTAAPSESFDAVHSRKETVSASGYKVLICTRQGCGVGGNLFDSDSLTPVEIVAHSKKSLFQQKFQKKFYHFNMNSQFRSVMQK